jgi:recombination DNA repair RAD52 pathway protein
MSENNLPAITKEELTKANDNMLNADQLGFLLKKTPKNHVYQRPGKGGATWNYVTGTYVKKVLNLMFGWDWSFEVVEHKFDLVIGQAYVLGKLTVNSQGKSIVKMQFGRVDIKFKRQTSQQIQNNESKLPLDIGNDLKAATTDALKKCAAELGIASDVYSPNEFKEIQILKDENPTIDPEEERIKSTLENITTQEELENIRPQITEKYLPLFKEAQKRINKKQ